MKRYQRSDLIRSFWLIREKVYFCNEYRIESDNHNNKGIAFGNKEEKFKR